MTASHPPCSTAATRPSGRDRASVGGISDDAISIIGRSESGDGSGMTDNDDDDGANASGAVKGAIGGAVGGTLLGIAALAIPGVGPLVAAGAIASGAIPGAAGLGAVIGATAGGVAGLLSNEGVDDDDASYYEGRINDGGYFVGVHTDRAGGSIENAREILYRNGGHSACEPRDRNLSETATAPRGSRVPWRPAPFTRAIKSHGLTP